jgi:transcriptional regulator with XRE-family HTH domain
MKSQLLAAKETFRDRLKLLMKGEKPYTWARKIGIEKGLFQYYWQKGKVPTYANLMKIQNYTGCSLDWLLMGKAVDFNQLEKALPLKAAYKTPQGKHAKMDKSIEQVKEIYSLKNENDIKLLEDTLLLFKPKTKSEKG